MGSVSGRMAWSRIGCRTTFACHELADLLVGGTMDVWIEWRKAGNGDVLGEEVEFGDPVPDIALGSELPNSFS